jgi:hypothetical protein
MKQIIKAMKITDINISNVSISTVKNNKVIPVRLNDEPLIFQTPYLEVADRLRKTTYPTIYQLDTLFKGDSKNKITNFFKFIENLETHICSLIEKNVSELFMQKNIILKTLIHEMSSDKNNYYIEWPICLSTNRFVDDHRLPFDPNNLKNKDLVRFIVEISNLWINNNQFGLAIVVQKINVKPFQVKIEHEYLFDDDTDSDNDYEDVATELISLLATNKKNLCEKEIVQNETVFKKKGTPQKEIKNVLHRTETQKIVEKSQQKTKKNEDIVDYSTNKTRNKSKINHTDTNKEKSVPDNKNNVHNMFNILNTKNMSNPEMFINDFCSEINNEYVIADDKTEPIDF